jgi:hypothetical protein
MEGEEEEEERCEIGSKLIVGEKIEISPAIYTGPTT